MSGKFDLGDYVEVKDRIRLFYADNPDGSIVTERVWQMTLAGDDYVCVEAAAYRTPDDPRPTRGVSWMKVPGGTTYTKGSELENTETSAWGRAIGARGIGIDKSVASANEVRAKSEVPADVGHSDDGGLIGIVEVGDRQTSDFVLRIDRDRGPVIGFRLRGDRGGILVRAFGPLAQQLFEGQEYVIRKRVTAYGRVEDVPAEGKARPYQRLIADRVSVPGLGVLPVPDEAEPDPVAPGQEPLFSAEDQQAIDEALAGVTR